MIKIKNIISQLFESIQYVMSNTFPKLLSDRNLFYILVRLGIR